MLQPTPRLVLYCCAECDEKHWRQCLLTWLPLQAPQQQTMGYPNQPPPQAMYPPQGYPQGPPQGYPQGPPQNYYPGMQQMGR